MTDLDKMPFGKHKGKPMSEVPVSYLHYLYTTGMKNQQGDVADYIKENLQALMDENTDLIWE